MSRDRYGPLPRDAPNFAVFAALDQDGGTLHVGDTLRVDAVAVRRNGQGGAQDQHHPTIWAYNRAKSNEEFRLDEDRFWHLTGQKVAVVHETSKAGLEPITKKSQ